MSKKNNKKIVLFIFVFLIIYILIVLYVPLFNILIKSFFKDNNFTIDFFKQLINSRHIMLAFANTILMSLFTVVTVNIVSIFQLLITRIYKIKFQKIFNIIFFTPFVFNSILLVYSYKYLYGSTGVITKLLLELFPSLNLNWFDGFPAILIVHTLSSSIYHYFFVKNSADMIDNSLIETSKNLGASNTQILFKIILPMIKPSIFSASIFVFAASLASNSAPTFLGSQTFFMINPIIRDFYSIGYDNIASILSLVLGVITTLLAIIFFIIEKKKRYYSLAKIIVPFKKLELKKKSSRIILIILSSILCIIYLLPILITVLYSFANEQSVYLKVFPTSFSLNNYIRVFSSTDILLPIINSIRLSILGVMITVIIGIFVNFISTNYKNIFSKILEKTLLLSWFLPSMVFAIGLIISYKNKSIANLGIIYMGSDYIIPFAYSFLIITIILYSLNAIVKNINPNVIETAKSLGSPSSYSYYKIILPLLKSTIISFIAVGITYLLTEFTISELLYNVNTKPISIIYRAEFTNPTPFQGSNIMVYTVIILLISIVLMYIVKNINKKTTIRMVK